jgi:O-antigen ligase
MQPGVSMERISRIEDGSPSPSPYLSEAIPARHSRLINVFLVLTILSSSVVMVEPSAYEVGVLIVAILCARLGVIVPRAIQPLIGMMLVWFLGSCLALLPVLHDSKAVTYFVITAYLQVSAVLFAWLIGSETERRLELLRTAYIATALVAAALGIAGYFKVLSPDILLENGRARALFKDPNVFAPFLILPILFLLQAVLYRGLRLKHVAAVSLLATALFLSFSRGAWVHFALSAAVMLWLAFITAENLRFRARLLTFGLIACLATGSLVVGLLSLGSVEDMFNQRASLAQSYDVGESGRFGRQTRSLDSVIEHPNGLGPGQFGKFFGQDPHNVYINAFVSYGWMGGFAFLTLTGTTLLMGFRAVLVPTPWQHSFMAVYATYVGLVLEGLIVDTDHWRHLFLLIGLIWGLLAATSQHPLRIGAARRAIRRDNPGRAHPVQQPTSGQI